MVFCVSTFSLVFLVFVSLLCAGAFVHGVHAARGGNKKEGWHHLGLAASWPALVFLALLETAPVKAFTEHLLEAGVTHWQIGAVGGLFLISIGLAFCRLVLTVALKLSEKEGGS